jgi:hypothetical protein
MRCFVPNSAKKAIDLYCAKGADCRLLPEPQQFSVKQNKTPRQIIIRAISVQYVGTMSIQEVEKRWDQ